MLVALASLSLFACNREGNLSKTEMDPSVELTEEPVTRASRSGVSDYQNLLTARTWVLTSVKEEGVNVNSAIGNKVTLKSDHTLSFDCSAEGGYTFDHTWEGALISPNEYGEVCDMTWWVYSYDNRYWLEIDDGFLLVFAQDGQTGVYEITSLTEDAFTVDIVTYDETWTLQFSAASFPPAGYTLVWNDEFNRGENLNDNWVFESGGDWPNNELQYYCANGEITLNHTTYKTASVSNSGTLKIKAYKVSPSRKTEYKKYISARMYTKLPDLSWQHGYIEMRAKLPTTAGCWSAFWMLLADGPSYVLDPSMRGGEIDILEHVPNDDVNRAYFSAHSYNATYETDPDSGYYDPVTGALYSYCQNGPISNPSSWHTYSMLWTHEFIRGYIDGVEYFYAPNPAPELEGDDIDLATWPFDQDYYLKLNLAIGGGWGGTPASNFNQATYEIDWIRVYQAQ